MTQNNGKNGLFHKAIFENDSGICLKDNRNHTWKEDCAKTANGSNRWKYNDDERLNFVGSSTMPIIFSIYRSIYTIYRYRIIS